MQVVEASRAFVVSFVPATEAGAVIENAAVAATDRTATMACLMIFMSVLVCLTGAARLLFPRPAHHFEPSVSTGCQLGANAPPTEWGAMGRDGLCDRLSWA